MFETMAQFGLADHMGGSAFHPPEGEMGYRRLLSRTRGPYATKDGHLAIVVYTERHWRAFTQLVGCPALLDTDERFASQQSRTLYAEDIGRFLAERLPARTNAEWLAACAPSTFRHVRSTRSRHWPRIPICARWTSFRPPNIPPRAL